ncbi:MAG TPA: hypothetical protein V6C91_19395 [Coleofasciculaceae cyanobacterium]
MSERREINENKPRTVKDSNPKPLSTPQVQDAIQTAIAQWKSQGISDWQILDIWATLAYQQGNYAVADTLASAAYELGKPLQE